VLKNIFNQIRILYISLFTIALLSFSYAQQYKSGIRTSLDQSRKGNTDLHFYEFFIMTDYPINFIKDNLSDLQLKLEYTIGLLEDDSTNSLLFSFGPVAEFNIYDNKIFLSGGISPSFMTKHTFNNLELGGSFNFISQIGVMFSPIEYIAIGYRFEHSSNAGFYENNPGFNIHFWVIRYNIKN